MHTAQRRKRAFIFAYKNNATRYYQTVRDISAEDVIRQYGFMSKAFPISDIEKMSTTIIDTDIVKVSDNFSFDFENAGYMVNGTITTAKVIEEEPPTTLRKIVVEDADEKYYIPNDKMSKWSYLKGAKKIPRTSADGHKYTFSKGQSTQTQANQTRVENHRLRQTTHISFFA